MRICRFTTGDDPLYGVVTGDLDEFGQPAEDSVIVALAGDPLYVGVKLLDEEHQLADVRLLAPVLPRSKVVGHRPQLRRARRRARQRGARRAADVPQAQHQRGRSRATRSSTRTQTSNVHYEGELAVVIGRICRDVPPEQATDVIHGYTIGNDVTARDLQRSDVPVHPGQGVRLVLPARARGSRPTSTRSTSPTACSVQTHLNGDLEQDGNTKDMIFDIPTLVAYVSSVMTLLPGDVILTGTPEGVGPMEVGDEVEVSIAGLGTLTNKVAQALSDTNGPRPDGAEPDGQPARRPGPDRPLQLGVRPPPRRHVRLPDRGHRRRPQHPGVLRLADRGHAVARPRLGRGPGGRRPLRAATASPSASDIYADVLDAAARVQVHLRLLLHHRGGRGAAQGVRLQGDGVRRVLPRAHRRAGRRRSGPRAGSRWSGSGCPTARSPSTTWCAATSPSRPSSCPTSRWPAPTATRSTRWSHPVDDALMEITHVLRGEDLLSSTPRQIALYDALQAESASRSSRPQFGHLPYVMGEGNKKLSKRDPEAHLLGYRDQGFLPEGLLNYLALLGWAIAADRDVFTLDEMVAGVRHQAT